MIFNSSNNFYQELVDQAQMNYSSNYWGIYNRGQSAFELSDKKIPYDDAIKTFAQKVNETDCVVVGGASGLSAAGGGDFYYENNETYRKYFGKYAKKYGFNGAFEGSFYRYDSSAEKWGYLITFLHTTLNAPIRKPYLDLDKILKDKDFFVITTNQDTQFVKLYPESKVAELQGDHRFFQCENCCTDDTWDSVKTVNELFSEMGENTAIPEDKIPRCPHCGGEAFPWVRGYGNFLQGTKYDEEYQKASDYLSNQIAAGKKILFLELGVGRMTPMFIQEPFWALTKNLPGAFYITVNKEHALLPKDTENKGIAIQGDIAKVLEDVAKI